MTRIEELERLCAEAYQVIGCFSDYLPDAKILDNLSQAKLVHDDVLPFVPVGLSSMEEAMAKATMKQAGIE